MSKLNFSTFSSFIINPITNHPLNISAVRVKQPQSRYISPSVFKLLQVYTVKILYKDQLREHDTKLE